MNKSSHQKSMACANSIGLGSKSMSGEDFFVLYILYWQQPTQSLKSYVYWLFCCMGMIVLESTMLRWFHHAFLIRGRLWVPNLVLYDKFRPSNMEKVWEYLDHIARISPERPKYGDKNLLKGKSIFMLELSRMGISNQPHYLKFPLSRVPQQARYAYLLT
jgi:hypothetical protein